MPGERPDTAADLAPAGAALADPVPARVRVPGARVSGETVSASAAGPHGRLRLSPREHTLFVGVSRSGKTTLAKWALQQLDNWVIIDPKRKDFQDWNPTEDPEDILRRSRCVFQPPMSAVKRPARDWSDPYSRALHYVWNFRSAPRRTKPGKEPPHTCTLFFDEAKLGAPSNPHPLLLEMIVAGMGRGLGIWAAMQSVFGVSPDLIDNAMAAFLFAINNASQRGILVANLGVESAKPLADVARRRGQGDAPSHDFVYWRQGLANFAGPYNLEGLRTRGKRS
jgi:hypothetical protein